MVGIGKNLSETFPIQNGLKQRFNFSLDCAVRKVEYIHKRQEMNGVHENFIYAGYFLGRNINRLSIDKIAEALIFTSIETGLE
jgi:hypothetical protein